MYISQNSPIKESNRTFPKQAICLICLPKNMEWLKKIHKQVNQYIHYFSFFSPIKHTYLLRTTMKILCANKLYNVINT